MIIWLPVLGSLAGVMIGIATTVVVPIAYATYLSVVLLATIDTGLGGMRGLLQGDFHRMLLITGFFGNSILAIALTHLGVRLGVDLYIAVVIVFTLRIFNNFGAIRRLLIVGKKKRRKRVLSAESAAKSKHKKHPRVEDE